jgi:photosystem II stability/assembly factor-like uncharacterized protein
MRQRLVFAVIILSALLLPTSLVGCASPAAPLPTEPVGVWEEVSRVPVAQPVRMGAFLDGTFGITGGSTGAGKAHYTTDGGDTWTLAEDSGGCLYGVDIVDSQNVWVCGRMVGASFSTPGGVRPSTDGGQTWNEQTALQTTPGRCPLNFLDAETGWVATGDELNATADGGATWEEITPDGVTGIAAIALRTPDEGYVLDDDGNLYTTSDGGQSWSSQSLLEGYGELEIVSSSDLVMAAVRFADADHGVVVMSVSGDGGSRLMALRTADGGQTWEQEEVMSSSLLIALYLSHDGSVLTIADQLEEQVIVLRHTG